MPMIALLLAAFVCAQSDPVPAAVQSGPPSPVEADSLRQLLKVRRVYVDRFAGGETAAQMRDMVISAMENSKLFVITENQERADAILRGSGEDLVFNEVHSSSDSLNLRTGLSSSRTESDGAARGGSRAYDHAGRSVNLGAGESESSRSVERRHEANAAVRLVSKDGDVIWSTKQESMGGKFRSASSDVADKVTKQLADDYERARTLPR